MNKHKKHVSEKDLIRREVNLRKKINNPNISSKTLNKVLTELAEIKRVLNTK